MKRRGRNEGAIYRRGDGLWCVGYSVGLDDRGQRRRRVLYGKTKRDVMQALDELRDLSRRGAMIFPEKITVTEFLIQWLDSIVRPNNRPSTHAQYRSLMVTHVMPVLGGMRLARLKPIHLIQLQRHLEERGASPRMRHAVHTRLHRALQQAVKLQLIPLNPSAAVDPPRFTGRAMRPLQAEEASAFLCAAAGSRLYPLYMLALTSGMRQGELLALRWKDLDMEGGYVDVQHSLYEGHDGLKLLPPKTAAGRRRIPLPKVTIDALRNHKKAMLAEGHPGPWVFCDSLGGPLRKSNLIRRSFHPLLKQARLPRIRFHDLRHTAATLLISKGVNPRVVQERLGHTNVAFTLGTYSHVVPSMQNDAVEKLQSFFAS